jgi:hypothetical protein
MLACACLCLSCFLLVTAAAAGCDRPRYTIYRAETPIVIDGRLDEPAWFGAPSVGPFRFAWWKSGKQEQTVAKILWDDNYLYVAYLCQDEHISAEHKGHDTPVWNDDCVEVFAAPNSSRPETYFNIEMNVNGAVYDDFHPMAPTANGTRILLRVAQYGLWQNGVEGCLTASPR